jgi:hypothetical protein
LRKTQSFVTKPAPAVLLQRKSNQKIYFGERKMKNIFLFAFVLAVALGFSVSEIAAQTAESRQQSKEIASLFNKTKHKIKEKGGIRVEVYIDINSEPAVKQSLSEYSGRYKSETDDWLDLKIGANGEIEVSGSEPAPQKSRRFKLTNAKIENALLTGTKVYEDGSTEKFEAAFLNRTVRASKNDAGTTTFGIGVAFVPPKMDLGSGFVLNKLFYEMK